MEPECTRQYLVDLLQGRQIVAFARVGSRVSCDPPPTNTDDDWVVRFVDRHALNSWAHTACREEEWTYSTKDSEYEMGGDFMCFREGETNLIATLDTDFFWTFLRAREVCRRLNVMDKEMRREIHRFIFGELDAEIVFCPGLIVLGSGL